ncbi:MAG: hypothetical protein PHI63_05870 [Patescibacteria group bacterium]|nr:hypothetical protein [Patescibacteria group bacterium]
MTQKFEPFKWEQNLEPEPVAIIAVVVAMVVAAGLLIITFWK